MILTLTDDLDDIEGFAKTVESNGGVNAHLPVLHDSLYILESTTAGLSPGTIRLVLHLAILGAKL